ncbi:MAG: hypothetical protein GY721_05940, partial [Deltaproteobacteria bacterium]|nr:hypothetical protein [Deltaproteobacteria bacterium]
ERTHWDTLVYNADFSQNSENQSIKYLTTTGYSNYLNSLKNHSGKIWQEIKSTILEYRPAVVGISATSQNFSSSCMIANIVKQVDKDIVVIVGGPHVSSVGSKVLNCEDIRDRNFLFPHYRGYHAY